MTAPIAFYIAFAAIAWCALAYCYASNHPTPSQTTAIPQMVIAAGVFVIAFVAGTVALIFGG